MPKAGRRSGIILVSGRSNSGKTTLIERLIPALRCRGLRVGTIKHAHHGFTMDHPGKDSWRHAMAGAAAVAVIAPTRAAWLVNTPRELPWATAAARMQDGLDLILIEGFKRARAPKIAIEPGARSSVAVTRARCRVGVRPDQLCEDDVTRLVAFCLRYRRRR